MKTRWKEADVGDIKIDLGSARIVTVRELARDTASVLREVNESGEPALISRHGKLISILAPLEGARLELHAIELISNTLPDVDELDDEIHGESKPLTEVLEQLRGNGTE